MRKAEWKVRSVPIPSFQVSRTPNPEPRTPPARSDASREGGNPESRSPLQIYCHKPSQGFGVKPAPGLDTGDPASVHDGDSVAEAHEIVQVR